MRMCWCLLRGKQDEKLLIQIAALQVPRVHGLAPVDRIEARYRQINAFEQDLVENDITIDKFFLHISKPTIVVFSRSIRTRRARPSMSGFAQSRMERGHNVQAGRRGGAEEADHRHRLLLSM
jgi:hypothetical protein